MERVVKCAIEAMLLFVITEVAAHDTRGSPMILWQPSQQWQRNMAIMISKYGNKCCSAGRSMSNTPDWRKKEMLEANSVINLAIMKPELA